MQLIYQQMIIKFLLCSAQSAGHDRVKRQSMVFYSKGSLSIWAQNNKRNAQQSASDLGTSFFCPDLKER